MVSKLDRMIVSIAAMKPRFAKYEDGLVPTIIQDSETLRVLMLGFSDKKSLKKTQKSGFVTFYSRSKKRLWTKGETSGNKLKVVDIRLDCDRDTLLILAEPAGPICHKGHDTCFREKNVKKDFLYELERFVQGRKDKPIKTSYTNRLLERGQTQIAKKLGEEAVELVIEAMQDGNDDLFKAEASDLLYHFIVMLVERGITLDEALEVLQARSVGNVSPSIHPRVRIPLHTIFLSVLLQKQSQPSLPRETLGSRIRFAIR